MPEPMAWLPFLAATLAMQVTPGPDMMLAMGRGIGRGRRTASCTVLGMTAGAGLTHLPLLALGVTALVASSPDALNVMRRLGAAYLIRLGIELLRNGHRHDLEATATPRSSPSAAVREGMIGNLLAPKSMTFMSAFLPQFIDPASGPIATQLLPLGGAQKACGAVVLGTVALASSAAGAHFLRHPRLRVPQARPAGRVMLALGLRLAFAGGPGG